MTLQEYFATPETVLPQELIYGVMRVAESPAPSHQEIVLALCLALHDHVHKRHLGKVWLSPLDVILDAERALVLQPDLFVILNDSRATVLDKVRGAPDLVIEVLSPHPRIGKIEERVEWFRQYGVRECWLVAHLTGTVQVLQFQDAEAKSIRSFGLDDAIASAVLPEFRSTLRDMTGGYDSP